jgi:hypothetical protein
LQIVWKPYGVEAFERFVLSYRSRPSALDHRLVFLFKGFGAEAQLQPFTDCLSGIAHERLMVPAAGLDIDTYLHAASRVAAQIYCFFNSRSVLLDDDWLAKLSQPVAQAPVGLSGATGSWQSLSTDFGLLHRRHGEMAQPQTWLQASFINRWRHVYYYPPFPNFHLRTNAFAIRRDVLARVRHGPLRSRVDVSRFESGRSSLTRQVLAMGLQVIVAGRDGKVYQPDEWSGCGAYWQQGQENLLVADNQTERYAMAGEREREWLRRLAWGPV